MKAAITNNPRSKESPPASNRTRLKRLFFANHLMLLALIPGTGIANDELAGISRGAVVLFQDDFKSETIGEFPSQWNLERGQAETAMHDGGKVMAFMNTNTTVSPRIENESGLPESFTLEFEYLVNHFTQHDYQLQFIDGNGRQSVTLRINGRDYNLSARGKAISKNNTPETSASFSPGWKQFALSFDQGVLRVFCGQTRILNVPRLEAEMKSIRLIGGRPANAKPDSNAFIRNVVITEGGGPIFKQIMEEGKFVTNEIQFDVNKAVIKPESASVIQQVFGMLQSHPELKFSVEGHTDSDGDAELNQRLSQDRAASVVRRLVEMGVAAERLTAKGWGASKPVAENDTAEGKAQNRRVEFVKM